MNKWIGIGVLAVAVGAGVAWQQGWLNTTSMSAKVNMTDYVPADTVFYAGGTADAKAFEYLRNMDIFRGMQGDLDSMLADMDKGELKDNPTVRFIKYLAVDLFGNMTTYGELVDHYGIDVSKPQAFYMDGVVPVIRISLANQDTFWKAFNEASEKSGLKAQQETVQGHTFTRWRLTPEGEAKTADLVVSVENGIATVTAFYFKDTEQSRLQRLAYVKPQKSLTDSGEIAELSKTYGWTGSTVAMLNIKRLAEGILLPDSNGFGRELNAILTDGGKPSPVATRFTAECRQEMAGLAGQVPRLMSSYLPAVEKDGKMTQSSPLLLEIKNAPTLASLQKLRGHIPAHTLDANGQIVGFGLGLDVNNLVPATTELWNAFTQAKFSCPELVEAQQQMASVSPAYLGMATGMLQGVKGAGFSLYDLVMSKDSPIPEKYSFLLSIATENPQMLLSMLSSSPFGAMVQIPADGSIADVDLSDVAPGLKIKAGVKGKFIVAYAGEPAQKAVDALDKETIDANGMQSLSFNYPKVAQLVDQLPGMVTDAMSNEMGSGCVQKATLAHMLRLPAVISYNADFSKDGLLANTSMTLTKEQPEKAISPVGKFNVYDQTFDCAQGDMVGSEEIRADGTGSYVMKDDAGQCDLSKIDYKWTQKGSAMVMSEGKSTHRDSCDAEWTAPEPYTARCTLMPADKGFKCLYMEEESQSLYHYQPAQ
ncbi:hypothetical protein WH50_02745 [Pokkaliibacter plantistimulans]|uniref:Uncharacterized protein n=1 Tax=Pokkaliibacter plantistimulans TaxID=1635171 RepID=A0ABX5M759_9GAMM|nr:hypothetical protein [Pokkaliibacter plantistimulans]PXF32730.1 hypothetical protein WH50_02745 [Pokkaliibacter plantistimulans]